MLGLSTKITEYRCVFLDGQLSLQYNLHWIQNSNLYIKVWLGTHSVMKSLSDTRTPLVKQNCFNLQSWVVIESCMALLVVVLSSEIPYTLQMQQQSMSTLAYLVLELDQSSWIIWAAEEMRQTLMIALTGGLVSLGHVHILKTREWSVCKV